MCSDRTHFHNCFSNFRYCYKSYCCVRAPATEVLCIIYERFSSTVCRKSDKRLFRSSKISNLVIHQTRPRTHAWEAEVRVRAREASECLGVGKGRGPPPAGGGDGKSRPRFCWPFTNPGDNEAAHLQGVFLAHS